MNRLAAEKKLLSTILVFAGLLPILLGACKDFSFFDELSMTDELTISPAYASLATGSTLCFSAAGGSGSYTFELITTGGGTIDPLSGVYTAPGSVCEDIVMVRDTGSLSATATVSVQDTAGTLEINPKVATLSPGGSITFVATGGVQPYTFSFQSNNSDGTLGSTSGVYAAGPLSGVTDTLVVTDANSTECTVAASVSVAAAVSTVNYNVSADSLPASAAASAALGGTFTIVNDGSGNGAKPVSWWLFLSEDGSFGGSGETLVASGATAALDAAAGIDVTPSGNWPALGGVFTIFVMISAEDDLTHGDNIYSAGSITLAVPDVDHWISSLTNLDATPQTFEDVDGWFRLENIGADGAGQAAQWELWLSADATIGVGDTRLYAGTATAALGAGGTEDIYFNTSGFWPSEAASYYLIARVLSDEDSLAGKDGNNDTVLGPVTITAPTVNYALTAVEYLATSEKVPGNTFSARFAYSNAPGADNGASTLDWTAYVSPDTTLDPHDALLATGGGLAPLDAGAASGWIGFTGTWPLHYGGYHIIVVLSTADAEPDLIDNQLASALVEIGYYTETESNNSYTFLPGSGYNTLTGIAPPAPVALKPGMTLKLRSCTTSSTDTNDVFMFNTGTAETIFFTATWSVIPSDLDLYLYRAPGGIAGDIHKGNTSNTDSEALGITRGVESTQFAAAEDLWLRLYCFSATGVVPYEVVISAE